MVSLLPLLAQSILPHSTKSQHLKMLGQIIVFLCSIRLSVLLRVKAKVLIMACNNDVQILVGIRITWKAYETRDCCAHSQSSGLAGPRGPAVLMAPSYVDTDAACQGITF